MTKEEAARVWDEAIKTCLDEGPSVQDRQDTADLMKRFRTMDLK